MIGSNFSRFLFFHLVFIFIHFILSFNFLILILVRFVLPLLFAFLFIIYIFPFTISFFSLVFHLTLVIIFWSICYGFFFVINNDLHLLEANTKMIRISFLFFEFLFKERGEIIVVFVLFKTFLCVHKGMIFWEHMSSDSFSWGKIFGAFVVAEYTHHSNFNFFL